MQIFFLQNYRSFILIKSVISDICYIDRKNIETEPHYDERRQPLQGVCIVPAKADAAVTDNLYYAAKTIWRTLFTTPHDILIICLHRTDLFPSTEKIDSAYYCNIYTARGWIE